MINVDAKYMPMTCDIPLKIKLVLCVEDNQFVKSVQPLACNHMQAHKKYIYHHSFPGLISGKLALSDH